MCVIIAPDQGGGVGRTDVLFEDTMAEGVLFSSLMETTNPQIQVTGLWYKWGVSMGHRK